MGSGPAARRGAEVWRVTSHVRKILRAEQSLPQDRRKPEAKPLRNPGFRGESGGRQMDWDFLPYKLGL